MGKAWTITDARGATVELWHGGGPEQVVNELEAEDRKQFVNVVWPTTSRRNAVLNVVLYLVAITAFATVVAVLWIELKPASWPSALTALFVGVPVGVFAVAVSRVRLRNVIHDPAYISSMLQLECCPACLYKLSGLDAADDGCTVCPECGGAWRKA